MGGMFLLPAFHSGSTSIFGNKKKPRVSTEGRDVKFQRKYSGVGPRTSPRMDWERNT